MTATTLPKSLVAVDGRRLRGYSAYKDSGVEWLGRVPAHWDMRRLKTIASVELSNVDKKSYEGDEPVRLCNYTQVYNNERLSPDMDLRSATATPEQVGRLTLREGDVLITKDSESWDDIAVAALVGPGDWRGVVCGYHLAVVRPIEPEMGPYLARGFSSMGVREQFYVASNGITRFALGNDAIRAARFPVPPAEERRAIVAFLDRETAKIDALVAKKERLIELLVEKRTALITQAVTKGLDPNVAMRDSGIEWLGQIPEGWQVLPNAALFRQRDLRGRGDLPILEVSIASGVHIREFAENRIEQRASDPATYKIAREGDVAFNKMRMWQGAVGVAPQDGLVSTDYIVAEPAKVANPRYYAALFRTVNYMADVYRYSHGIVDDRNRLYWDDFKSMKSPVPPRLEQENIVRYVEAETAKTDAFAARVAQAIERLKELRTALVSAAVNGRIDVRD